MRVRIKRRVNYTYQLHNSRFSLPSPPQANSHEREESARNVTPRQVRILRRVILPERLEKHDRNGVVKHGFAEDEAVEELIALFGVE